VPTPTGGTLSHSSYYGSMLDLPDGTTLYSDFNSQIYSYQPDGVPLAAAKPAITSVSQNADGTYHVIGTQLNGLSEGSCYGDDNQNNTNYPLVRLTSGTTVYHARTFNWSRTSVATGSTPVTTEFILPPGLPQGTYSLTVVANGISSDPLPFNVNAIAVTLPASVTEGASGSGTVTLPSVPASNVTVNLSSATTSRATVPASVTVLGGQTSATFSVTAVEDSSLTGDLAVAITAAAAGYQTGVNTTNIQDNETAILSISPTTGLTSTGAFGGPFTPASATYTLTNTGNTSLNWTTTNYFSYHTLSPSSGTLAAGANTTVTMTVNSAANTAAVGGPYTPSRTVVFNNTTTGDGNRTLTQSLTVTGAPVMSVTTGNFSSAGQAGGPFVPSSIVYTITNSGTGPLSWTAAKTATWLTFSSSSGTINPGLTANVTVSINTAVANSLAQANYADTVTFTNATNGTGNTSRAVALQVQQRVQNFDLTTDPVWTRQGEWAYGQPGGSGGEAAGGAGNNDPNSGYTGSKVFGVNLAGNYSTAPGGPYYLTAGPFNLTGDVLTKLRFRRWLNTDAAAWATIDVSNDGTTWTNVYSNAGTAVGEFTWQQVQYDISAVADNKSAVYVRWGYQAGTTAYSGWNIDDVELLTTTNATSPTATPQTLSAAFGAGTSITLAGVDTNTPVQPLIFAVATQPAHGTITGTAPNLPYTPADGYHGPDSFTFTCTNS
jgi:hypothetical protein